jgi:hypothetical protein
LTGKFSLRQLFGAVRSVAINSIVFARFKASETWNLDIPKGSWVLSRTACLGNDVFSSAPSLGATNRINLQKLRIDQFETVLNGNLPKKLPFGAQRFLARKDVFPLLLQQTRTSWLKSKAPMALLMDSFSDLTDQEFSRPDGTRFFAAYSDVAINHSAREGFECKGLLDLADYEAKLKAAIGEIRAYYSTSIPVVYIHFPHQLETRQQFIKRAKVLIEVTRKLERELSNFFVVEADSSIVRRDPAASDNFPYHYHPNVTQDLTRKVEVLLASGLSS